MALTKWEQPQATETSPQTVRRPGMERLFEEFLGNMPKRATGGLFVPAEVGFVPAVDLKENEHGFELQADLPGIAKEDLEIDITEDSVTLRGERKDEFETGEACFRCRESIYGAFHRQIEMPGQIVPEDARATLENGMLTLTLPKAEQGSRKHVRVKVE